MKNISKYANVHRLAKAIVCLAYIGISNISIESGNPYLALYVGTVIWFFGVNFVAFLLEAIFYGEHYHNVF